MIATALLLALFLPAPAPRVVDDEIPVVRIDDDPHRRYVLHGGGEGEEAPEDGWKVLLVLPGGDGSPDFAPFVGRIREHALGEDWLAVQVVAPMWDEEQAEKVVWPTERLPWKGMECSSEELVREVLEHVGERHELDPRFVFTLAWSSSGSLAYTLGLEEETPVTGTFVAMSVYEPRLLPDHEHAKGRAFYLLHSPEDFIPIRMAREARDELTEAGADVVLETYEGGHGWRGDVYGRIRAGIAWLEERAPERRERRR